MKLIRYLSSPIKTPLNMIHLPASGSGDGGLSSETTQKAKSY